MKIKYISTQASLLSLRGEIMPLGMEALLFGGYALTFFKSVDFFEQIRKEKGSSHANGAVNCPTSA